LAAHTVPSEAGPSEAGPSEAGPSETGTAESGRGLFGPDSVTRRVMTEPVMWVGGFRALYLQALHPRVMRGTWQNTAFTDRKKAFGRFLRTAEFVGVRTYGNIADAERAAARVRRIHASLRGTDPDGTTFRLDEPELLLWVHCAEAGSYADIARRSGVPLSAAELDTFVAEQRRSAALVGLDPGVVPGSRAELEDYFSGMRPRLRAGPEARQALRASCHPPMPASLMPLRVALPPFSMLAFATLPRWARRMYGIPDTAATDLAATAALHAARRASTGLPGRLLYEPAVRRIFTVARSAGFAEKVLQPVRADALADGQVLGVIGDQVVGEVEQLVQPGVGDGVDDPPALPVGVHEPAPAQAGKVVGHPAARQAGPFDHLADAARTGQQHAEDLQPVRVGKHTKPPGVRDRRGFSPGGIGPVARLGHHGDRKRTSASRRRCVIVVFRTLDELVTTAHHGSD